MPCVPEAVQHFQSNGVLFGPGKATNAGGVAVSGLEMSQNSERLAWTREEVDGKLDQIMTDIHTVMPSPSPIPTFALPEMPVFTPPLLSRAHLPPSAPPSRRRPSAAYSKVAQPHSCLQKSAAAAEQYGSPGDYVAGANIAGFVKVADAMLAQGIL